MCGITGWTDWSRDLGEQRSILERMTRTLAPRGPDAEGLWLSRHALLGHRRLAIIDLENGAQPMLAEAGGRVALTYSGEVYNFRELRAELETLGQVFRTRSDTEVVLRAYLQWGEASFARLRGIYGFALWDEREQSLWLVRDRFGVKPLYYYPTAGGVLFASEPKAIFANPEANPVLDASGIAELFALTTAPTPGHGLYKGLRQVRPGQALRFDRNGVRELVYWALRAERHEEGAEDSAERAGQLLREAVAEQLVADVPLGSLLSGGLDSSAISAFAVAALDGDARRLPTFSVDFPGEGRGFVPTPWQSSWDEPYAQLAANFLGTPHRTVLVAPEEVLEQDEAVLQARDLPGWGELDASLYLLFRQVREHTTVALSGESADEVFGGYPFFHDPSALAHDGFLAGRQERALATAAAGGRRTGGGAGIHPGALPRGPRRSAATGWRGCRPAAPARGRLPGAEPLVAGDARTQGPDEHGGRPGSARAVLRPPPGGVRMEPALGAEERRRGKQEPAAPGPARAPAAGDPGAAQERFPGQPRPTLPGAAARRVGRLLADGRSPLFELVDAGRSARLEQGTPLPSPRASASPTAGLAYLLNLDRWLTRHGVDISL